MWDFPTMDTQQVIPATVDSRRRAVLPEGIPPGSAITYQQLDKDTWIVRRHRPSREFVVVLVRDVKHLPEDPEWDKVESAFANHAYGKLPPFEE